MVDNFVKGMVEWGDKRVHRRMPVVRPVQLQHSAGPQPGLLMDLSASGAGVKVEDPPAPGTKVNLAIELEDLGRLDALSMVVRVGPVVGLQFIGLSPEEYLLLRTFLVRQAPRVS
jgi:hypothetical protein